MGHVGVAVVRARGVAGVGHAGSKQPGDPEPPLNPANNKTPPSDDNRPPSNRAHNSLPATGGKPGR